MIYIARHGETSWNAYKILQGHKPIELNEKGRERARFLAEKVKEFDFNRIISSDLLRAKETAEIINMQVQKKIIYDARLRSVDYGNLEGRYIPDITQEEWKIYNSTPEKFGAESVESVYNRIKSLFDELIESDESVLIIAHGGSLRVISYYIANRHKFDNEIYCKFYKDAKQVSNTALFKWKSDYTELEPIYY
jgi:broad specificity phosphatase PhoE